MPQHVKANAGRLFTYLYRRCSANSARSSQPRREKPLTVTGISVESIHQYLNLSLRTVVDDYLIGRYLIRQARCHLVLHLWTVNFNESLGTFW
jgi:hypothetical protein